MPAPFKLPLLVQSLDLQLSSMFFSEMTQFVSDGFTDGRAPGSIQYLLTLGE
jgi:hypothetical protein